MPKPKRVDPQTSEGWQAAVNAAQALLVIDAARQYGLITGGPNVNQERCVELLDEGKKRGFTPAADAAERFTLLWQMQYAQVPAAPKPARKKAK